MTLPSLFISHGAPTFALTPGQLGPQLRALGEALPRPRAVLVMSPHWSSATLTVDAAAHPATVHDFNGFGAKLHTLDYPAPGAPEVAESLVNMLASHGLKVVRTTSTGRDHGTWVPLMHLYPAADVPVLRLSQPYAPSPLALLELGRAVAALRDQGVLIVGSGSLTHNLYELGAGNAQAAYADDFAQWIWDRIADGDLDALLNYRTQAPAATRAHPTDEHLLPLFFAIGAAGADWAHAQRLRGGITYDVVSMDSFIFSPDRGEHRATAAVESTQTMELL